MPDLLGRKFTANAPNRVYVGDITYLPCKGGKNMYLATVIDTYSRKLAGYALADHMRVSLVIDALAHAHGVRGSLDGAISIQITVVCTLRKPSEITARRWVCASP
ncbi:DDE-type integrase/transposase/recombinase [Corynebacterium macginleyi]|uniref:DDE-type integrase/transposase/recombinase n=1 Tax=Corynebacterium macginleyi TaxID=38290 RepID=UPI0019098854|nr:DDE-type integrase/transposase/recombinase [Corynebacterium macginleyi]